MTQLPTPGGKFRDLQHPHSEIREGVCTASPHKPVAPELPMTSTADLDKKLRPWPNAVGKWFRAEGRPSLDTQPRPSSRQPDAQKMFRGTISPPWQGLGSHEPLDANVHKPHHPLSLHHPWSSWEQAKLAFKDGPPCPKGFRTPPGVRLEMNAPPGQGGLFMPAEIHPIPSGGRPPSSPIRWSTRSVIPPRSRRRHTWARQMTPRMWCRGRPTSD